MKNIRLKLLMIVLVLFSFTFFMSIDSSKAIYRETKSTTINLSIVEAPTTYTVTFNSDGGTSVPSRNVEPNHVVGTLPIPTKANSNFTGWYDSNGQRVRHTALVTSDMTLTAHWTDIVCKRVTDDNKLHTETCMTNGGCTHASSLGLNALITYGYTGDGIPIAGDAYDCDVDDDGTFDALEENTDNVYTERFYFVRSKVNSGTENSAVMLYSTSFDANGRAKRSKSTSDIGSAGYETAEGYLPTSSLWDNPLLINLGGKISRFISEDDLESVCGEITISNTSYFNNCGNWMWFENTRFQAKARGRAGIWIEKKATSDKYRRIHTESFDILEVANTSENMARPVIEIPMSALEGYYNEDRFTISFNTYQGDTNVPGNILKYRGETLGTLPTPTREHFEFLGWYTDSGFENPVDLTALISGNMTLYAKWEADDEVTVTLYLNGGTIVLNGNTITSSTTTITLNSGDLLDDLPDPTRTGYTFLGWFTDSILDTPFDDKVPITADTDLYAKWGEMQTVTVTLHLDGGSIVLNGNTISSSTTAVKLNSGDLLDDLPDPTRTGYTFLGWYTDSTLETSFDDTVPITSNMDLYAKWELGNYVAKIGNTPYQTLAAAINAVPTGKVKTRITLLKDVVLTSKATIPNTKYVELDLQNFTLSTSSATLIDNSGTLDIINGTYIDSFVSSNAGYVIHNKSGAILNISGGTLIYDNVDAKESKVIQNEGGTVNITGGIITCNSQAAAINNKGSSGVLNVTGGEIIGTSTTKGQGIYIDTGATTYIGGDVVIKNVSKSSGKDYARAAVDNAGGTLIITGGTIISEQYAAVDSRNGVVTNIGINDNTIDTTTPILYGKVSAVNNDGGTINAYDGVYKTETVNVTSSVLNGTGTVTIPTGTEFGYKSDETYDSRTYHVYYLKYITGGPYTVTFDADNGTSTSQVTGLQALDTVNTNMPSNPTKTNYIFEKWFVYKEKDNEVIYDGEFTSATPVTDNITVKAKWKPGIGTATITPSSISINTGETVTIEVTGQSDIEDYAFTSMNTSVATVDENGVVTGVGAGSTTIKVTGAISGEYQEITVTVTAIVKHTVTFYNELNGTVIKTVEVNHGSEIGSSNMPTTNPTKTNYVFNNWYINGDTNTPVFTGTSVINANTNVIATWFESVSYATLAISPDPMTLEVGSTGTITLNPTVSGDAVESYTCTSNNTSIATVNNCVVTAVAAGNTTITITRSNPLNTKTVNVTVNNVIITHTVKFYDELNGTVIKTVEVEHGTQIGSSNMPTTNPTKTNYVFNNWYINGDTNNPVFTNTSVINADTNVIATWFESVSYATMVVNPNPMELNINGTGTITLNPTVSGDTVESYTCTSNNTSIATVNNCVVTGVGEGSTTITITGSDPLSTKTVNVTVISVKYTVIFDKNNGEQDAVVTINNVESGTLLSTIIPTDPSKTDCIFDNWYQVEDSTWTNNKIDPTMTVSGDLEFRASYYTSTDVAAIGHTYYTTYKAAIDAVPTTKVETEVRLLQDAVVTGFSGDRGQILSTQNVYLNGNGHTLSCTGTKKGNTIWNNGGTITLKDITVTCDGIEAAPIDSSGTVTIIDSSVIANLSGSNGRAAIYNGTNGKVTIKGNSYLSTIAKDRSTVQNANGTSVMDIQGGTIVQAASDSTKYAVEVYSGSKATISGGTIRSVHNPAVYNAGTLTITGGTIISEDGYGITNSNTNLTIGTKDNAYDVTSPVIQGETYGINSTANYSIYDGIIKGKTNSQAVNDFNKITKYEDDFERQTGTDGDYYTLYYSNGSTPTPTPTPTPQETHTITFQSVGGTVSPASTTVNDGDAITSNDLPTATWGDKTLAGWYLDEDYTNAVVLDTTTPDDDMTLYAKWTVTKSVTNFDSTNDAMKTYFNNISSWKNLSEADFMSQMSSDFSTNNCSSCNAANSCDSPLAGNQCDKPKAYDTNTSSSLKVFLYDETSHTILDEITYANASSGTLSNLIPGVAYYWEKESDSTVNGVVKVTTPRRVLDVGNIRNVRDLGGLSISYTENSTTKTGTIKYGKLLRGAKLSSSNSDVTALTNLGINREIDLRPSSEGSGQAKLPLVDNGSGTDIIIHNYLINNVAITPYTYLDKNGAEQTTVAANSSYANELKSALKSTMQHIINGDNIYFHCTIGTDRTGTLAYFLEGLLGVSEEDRVEDYELTYFFGLTNRTRYHDYLSGSDINPRFTFMHLTYPTNQDIYNWYTTVSPASDDLTVLSSFRNTMINFN